MLPKLFISCVLLFMCAKLQAQLQIKYNGKEINYKGDEIEYAFVIGNNFSTNALFSIKASDWKKLDNNIIPISFNSSSIWLKIPLQQIRNYGAFDLVEVDNPHVNFLRFWIIQNDTVQEQSNPTGDNTVFTTRPLQTTSFVMPIKNTTDGYLIIAADKKFTKLDLPIYFNTYDSYFNNQSKKDLLLGFFVGILILLCCINISMYIAVKESVYLWYSIYLFLISSYVLINEGVFFKFLYPNLPFLNDVVRPGVITLSSFPLILFFNQLLNIKKNKPVWYKWNIKLLLAYCCIFLLAIFSSFALGHRIQGFWLGAASFVSPLIMLYILAQSIYFFIIKVPYSTFSLASFGGFALLLTIFVLGQNQIIKENVFTNSANYIGILYESLVVLIALIWRYKVNKKESEFQLALSNQNRQNLYNEISIWQEKEMQRMSSLLHDTIGANLGFLRLETDNMKLSDEGRNKIAEHITRIGNEVRSMSHSFSPIILQDKGLYNAIDEIVKTIRNNSTIDLQFEWIGDKQKISLQYEIIIYRIVQEILQNLLKHSKAQNAFLQILIEQKLISIYAEDDGVGIGNNENNNGVGLKSIENLVTLLKGSYRVESTEQDGFSISIEFNQQSNEKI